MPIGAGVTAKVMTEERTWRGRVYMENSTELVTPKLVGARIARREDRRFLTGRGAYVDDVTVHAIKQGLPCGY